MDTEKLYKDLFSVLKFSYEIFEKAENILADGFLNNYYASIDTNSYLKGIPCLSDSVEIDSIKNYFSIKTEYIEPNNRIKFYKYIITRKSESTNLEIIFSPSIALFGKAYKSFRSTILREGFNIFITTKKSCFPMLSTALAIIIKIDNKSDYSFSTITGFDELYDFLFNQSIFKREIFNIKTVNDENLSPEFYNRETQTVNSLLDTLKAKKLSEFATILPWITQTQEESDFNIAGIPYITHQNIKNCNLIWDEINEYIESPNLYVTNAAKSKYLRRLLKAGDIIIPKINDLENIYYVEEDDLPAIAGQHLIVIRAAGIESQKLYHFIKSKTGRDLVNNQMKSFSDGSATPYTNELYLREVKFPSIDLLSSAEIENIYNDNIEEIKEITTNFIAPKIEKNKTDIQFDSILEENIYSLFLNKGWCKDDVCYDSKESFIINESKRIAFYPDIILRNNSQNIAIVEAKLSTHIDRINEIKQRLLSITQKYRILFILTTGSYFEIYRNEFEQPIKIFNVPSKELLLNLLEGGIETNE